MSFIGGSTVAEHMPPHPKVEGSSPLTATDTGREKSKEIISFESVEGNKKHKS
jgi:hypothetical protein